MSTDWREMEAGIDLDRLVAERAGWLGATRLQPYSTSVDAALTLIPSDIYTSYGYQPDFGGKWFAMVWGPKHIDHFDTPVQRAETPALAICRAWLAWQDSKQADGGQ